jgi:hypothetical protein
VDLTAQIGGPHLLEFFSRIAIQTTPVLTWHPRRRRATLLRHWFTAHLRTVGRSRVVRRF